MLILQLLDHLLLLCSSLTVLQVVHIQLVLQVVNVRVLLNISAIETLQLRFKSLILFLEFWFDVLNSFKALICAFQFHPSSLDRVLQDCLITSERLYRLLHLLHFARLSIDNISNALFNVLLLGVLVQVATD